MSGKVNILLVDDRRENLLCLEAMLGDLDQNLVRAGHDHVALRQVLQEEFALIVLDVDASSLDGLVTAEIIRRQEESRHVPILLLTDSDRLEEQVFRGHSLGMIDYLAKPVLPEVLRSKVMVFLELDNLRQERARLLREVRLANRGKDEFLRTLSHEIRTPLNAVLGWIQILRSRRVDEVTTARAMEAIERNAKRQVSIIQDMLDASQLITGKLQMDFQLVEFEDAITAALDAVRPTAQAKGVRLECDIERTGTRVSGDVKRLEQIVWNLVSNSIKFTPAAGSVRVLLERKDTQLRLTVTDSGRGIDREFLPFVFDRFRQNEAEMTRSYRGLGLGLSIVRHLVELHGGIIEAASEGKGQGATFTVLFPICEVLPAPVRANAG